MNNSSTSSSHGLSSSGSAIKGSGRLNIGITPCQDQLDSSKDGHGDDPTARPLILEN